MVLEGSTGFGTRALVWLRYVGHTFIVGAILLGVFLPLYTDEIGWRLQERAGFDGVDKLLTELCGPNTMARPPPWMLPVRYYSSFFNAQFAEPIFVRLSGILYALIWLALVLMLIRQISHTAADRLILSILAVGFISLGTMPLILVWSRPEQPILLAFTGAILIVFTGSKKAGHATPEKTAWMRSLAILVLALIAMSYHLKAIFLVPLFLVCIFFASRERSAHVPRIVAAALLGGAAGWAAYYWIHRLQCPNDASMHANFVSNNFGAALVSTSNPSQITSLLGKALDNISLFQYLGMPAPREEPMSYWLEPFKIGFSQSFAWFLVMICLWLIALVLAGYCLAVASRRGWRDRELDARPILSATLVLTVLGWSATQGYRNVYEASFIVPMMVLAVVLALSPQDGSYGSVRGVRLLAFGVGVLGIVSIGLVALIYGRSLAQASGERGYIAKQHFSISAFGYPRLRREMLGAARKCGIVDPDANHALLLDDVTYFAFMQSRMPEHYYGLLSPAIANKDPIAYLRGIKSDGVVVSCRVLPPNMRARAKREGQFCCLAPPGW